MKVAVIAPGAMGSAVGRRLSDHGVQVVTLLEGRSADSVRRAEAARMIGVAPDELCRADIFLSIVPPGEAVALAKRLSANFATAPKKPVYADCNAINPRTVKGIARIIESAGCDFVNAGIIGGPPRDGAPGPVLYLSGAHAAAAAELGRFGLECRVLDGDVGAASALKMSYAGITKGLTALASMMILAAHRAGTGGDLHAELEASQPTLLAWFERQIPSMFAKAYRWVAEMEEIAEFVEDDGAARELFESTAKLYRRLAQDFTATGAETDILSSFFQKDK